MAFHVSLGECKDSRGIRILFWGVGFRVIQGLHRVYIQ